MILRLQHLKKQMDQVQEHTNDIGGLAAEMGIGFKASLPILGAVKDIRTKS